jgi:hypothetical protein
VEITGDATAKMKWKNYFMEVVAKYLVVIEGWPAELPFGNLSDVVTSLPALENIHHLWLSGGIHFRTIGDDEFNTISKERDDQVRRGEIPLDSRKTRSDKGKKRARSSQGSKTKKKPRRSAEEVISSSESSDSSSDADSDESSD